MSDVLIVKEKNSVFSGKISTLVMREGLSVCVARSLDDAEQCMCRECPAVMLLDMEMLNRRHVNLVKSASMLKDIEVMLLTLSGNTLRALRISAPENCIETVSEPQLRDILVHSKQTAKNKVYDVNQCPVNIDSCGRFGSLYGRSPLMRHVYEQIACIAPTGGTVLIVGESGTGKEQVAQTVHSLSSRSQQVFIPVNCGAICPQLVESEMFGHEKGSFTGASTLRRGFFEQADGGTLFLDEVTEMPCELQVKFLRVLETGNFMRIGATLMQHTNVRIIAATNASLEKAVTSGKLREDLFYRLNVFPIYLPPLRERREDIPLLVGHFLKQICDGEKRQKYFSSQAIAQMCAYDWPGNVRELRNAVLRGFVMSRGDEINDEWQMPAGIQMSSGMNIEQEASLAVTERSLIQSTLERFNGHRGKAAAALGISQKTLYNRLKKYAANSDVENDSV